MNSICLVVGAGISVLWGLGHLAPTKAIVGRFGEISPDNRRIALMEWIAEGLTLIFLGALALLVSLLATPGADARLVIRAVAAMLVIMAGLTAATGARTSILPMRFCPFVKLTSAALLLVGSWG